MKNGAVALKKHNLKENQHKKVIKLSLVSSVTPEDGASTLCKQKQKKILSLNQNNLCRPESSPIARVIPSRMGSTQNKIIVPSVLPGQEKHKIANDPGDLKDKRHVSECYQMIFSQVGTVSIKIKSFDQLTAFEIYNILKLRQDTFVLEKEIMYEDIDCKDYHSIHVWCQTKRTEDFLAYLRIVPFEDKDEVSIGRVLTVPNARGQGIARQLMESGIDFSSSYYSNSLLKLYAREELCPFYETLGFEKTGAVLFYPEKNPVPNIPMIYKRKLTNSGSSAIQEGKKWHI